MDQSLFHLINQQWTSPALDLFMAALSDSEIWKPLFIAIGVSALFLGGFRARAFVICLVLSLLIASSGHGSVKISGGSPSAKTRGECAHGPVAKDASGIPDSCLRNRPFGFPIHPIATGRDPRFPRDTWSPTRYRGVLHAVLSTPRLALLVCRLGCWLFANLSGCTLAQRRDRYVLSGRWRSTAFARPV